MGLHKDFTCDKAVLFKSWRKITINFEITDRMISILISNLNYLRRKNTIRGRGSEEYKVKI